LPSNLSVEDSHTSTAVILMSKEDNLFLPAKGNDLSIITRSSVSENKFS